MLKRAITLTSTVVSLAMVGVLVMGLAGTVSAFAAASKKPVVLAVSPAAGTVSGGNVVVITGKNFKVGGKSVVTKVTFGTKKATQVSATSATSITATVPAGKGAVDVRVVTKAGGISPKVKADTYTYRTATKIALKAGDNQSASVGAAVAIAPSVRVTDAKSKPVAGVSVTFAVATGGGSVTDASAMTDASGVATVGSWKLGIAAGTNTMTATSTGLTGSPVTFTATGSAGILLVEHNGTPVRAYSLDELKALTPFAGWAGLFKSPAIGPDAVTGVKVTDVVADALGTALATTQSVGVTNVVPPGSPYTKTFTHDQLVNLAGSTTFSYYNAMSRAAMTPTGTLAAILIYSDPVGAVMPVASGPLRFAIADSVSENMVYGPTNTSVSTVNQLNVISTP